MNYHNITKDDMLNGDGLRVVLWTAGCNHHCRNCQNPVTWDAAGGLPFDAAAEEELFGYLARPYITGITFSGGDPLHPANVREVGRLVRKAKSLFPNKTVWLYTGSLFEEILDLDFLPLVDVLVDGEFVEAEKDTKLHWKGSANQRVIDVPASLASGAVVLHA